MQPITECTALCIPGRSPDENMDRMNHGRNFESTHTADKVLGMGMTRKPLDPLVDIFDDYFAACPVLDLKGDLVHFDFTGELDDFISAGMGLEDLSSMQNSSTRALFFLEEAKDNNLIEEKIIPYGEFDFEQVTRPKLELNRCLRMPGSTCYSDYDCTSSDFITKSTRHIDPDDISLNPYELSFWQETLVCSQKNKPGDEDYKHSDNRCCRETGKTLTIGTWQEGSPIFENLIPGIELPMDSNRRYSLYNITADLAPGLRPFGVDHTLQGPRGDDCNRGGCLDKNRLDHQFKTFPKIPERICCSGDWVRRFHESNDGGGHHWEHTKHHLKFKVENFSCYNWIDIERQARLIGGENPGGKNPPFTCELSEQPSWPDCGIRAVKWNQARDVLNWLGILELTGIPQAVMAKPWDSSPALANLLCEVDGNQRAATTANTQRIPGVFATDVAEVSGGGNKYFSMASMENFNSQQIKQVFSPDEVVCCLPAGTKVDIKEGESPDPDQCCTGFISTNGRCALRDYTDISVYFNRFVSSAAKGLDENQFDSNGFIKAPALVERLACEQNVCDSGKLARGVAWSYTKIPGKIHETEIFNQVRQFLDNSEIKEEDDFNGLVSLFEVGLKWNTHVYCVPKDLDDTAPELVATKCNPDEEGGSQNEEEE